MRSFILLFLLAGCAKTPGNPTLPTGDFAVVTTSGGFGAGGAVNTIRLSDKEIVKGLDTSIDQDNQVRVSDGKAFVLNRTPGTLRIYDFKKWVDPVEIPTGDATHPNATSNPIDVAPGEGTNRVFVTLAGNDAAAALGVIDTTNKSGIVRFIALPTAAADPDGKPEPGQIYRCDSRLFVLMQGYDSATFNPAGPGRIAIIDEGSERLEGFITMERQAPYGISAISSNCNDVLVANSGPFGKGPDGTAGIEHVDLKARKSLGVLVTDVQMMGRPSTVSVVTRELAFAAIYYDLQPQPMGDPILSSAKVIAFDPMTGAIKGDVLGKSPFIPFTAVSPDGQLIVGVDAYPGSLDEGKLKSGIYLGKADGTPLSTTPIDLGQNPYAIAFQ